MLRHNLMLITPIALLLAIGTGCGASSYKYASDGSSFSGNESGSSTDNTVVNSQGASISGKAPYRVPVHGTGYNGVTVTLSVGTTLKVAYIPGKQNAEYNGTFYPYSMMSVYLGVGTSLQPTQALSNGYASSATQSQTIDLTGTFSTHCTSDTPSCRKQITVLVTQPQDDESCWTAGAFGCSLAHVQDGHPWNGTLLIQTDDTTTL